MTEIFEIKVTTVKDVPFMQRILLDPINEQKQQ